MATAQSNFNLSIIIPARNEANRLGNSLKTLSEYLKAHDLGKVEVIMAIDAASRDASFRVAGQSADMFKHFRIIHEHFGSGHKGAGVQRAMLDAKGEYRLFMDADLATPLHHLEEVKHLMQAGVQMIIGVRNLEKTHAGIRKYISLFGNFLVRLLLGIKFKDTQCGFKAFKADVAEDLFRAQTIPGWGFDMEILAVGIKRGYSIKTIAIDDWQDVAGGTLGVGPAAALSTFKDLLTIKWNMLKGSYRLKGGHGQTG